MKTPNDRSTSVGEILRSARQAQGLSLVQVELATRIRGKFLLAIEAGDYEQLQNDIYAYGFVRTYANYLKLSDNDLAKRYIEERGGALAPVPSSKRLRPEKRVRNFILTPRLLTVALILVSVIGVGSYLSWQFALLAAAPRLEVFSPSGDAVVETNKVEVKGRVNAGVEVAINDVAVLTDPNGNFSESISLAEGVNTIKVTARNKLGKSTSVTRNILVKPRPKEPEPQTPSPQSDTDTTSTP